MIKKIVCILSFVPILIGCLWGLGLIISDRWGWSQWIAWIPTLVVIGCFVIAVIITRIVKLKTLSSVCTVLAAVTCIWFVFFENRLMSSGNQIGDLRIVGWTMSHPKQSVASASAELIVELDADITLLTSGWIVRGEKVLQDWLTDEGYVLISGPFTMLTRLRPVNKKILVASDGIYISQFTLDATSQIGQHITLWAVDFPSTFSKQRFETAKRALRLLKTVEFTPPDIVLGDFNMTRNSASINKLFPTLHDATSDGGSGWLASYPLSFPLYHIDHILLRKTLRANSYKLMNPHIGRHRIQISEIERAN